MDERELAARLAAVPEVGAHPGLAEIGAQAFAHAVVLLDNDDNLTRLGNPTGEARAALRERILSLLGGTPRPRVAIDDVELE